MKQFTDAEIESVCMRFLEAGTKLTAATLRGYGIRADSDRLAYLIRKCRLAHSRHVGSDTITERYNNWELKEIPDDPDADEVAFRAWQIRHENECARTRSRKCAHNVERRASDRDVIEHPGRYGDRVPEVCADEPFGLRERGDFR
jgi:hypothetical protein